ncbi:TIGR02996 domain-containing protein [Limnoglobus roseus]|uniref:TIGR02996 domain-containing protein n=1 Tax=Limnoglobus roseus TaxID=2598579 RepID=A0A5C1A9P9_9BACT|nr:TIGR02996 domain-containing protein [Limnoglobus roseus]QEL15285.1 TIGR02996 domain-containing protein [Limnoglobus roseus]
MSRTTEAQALFKAALDNPADEVARLVFADWLEDGGTAADAAWARYVRLGTVAHHGAMRPQERTDRRALAARDVTTTMELPFDEFVPQSVGLLQLLPAPNITVRLAGVTVPVPVASQVWEWVAQGMELLPVDWSGWHASGVGKVWTERTLIVASADPRRLLAAVERDEVEFAKAAVYCVRAYPDELAGAIDRSYARLREETTVRTLLLGFPTGWQLNNTGPFARIDVPPVVRLVQGILGDAINRQSRMVRMAPESHGSLVSMRDLQGWREWNVIPWWLQNDVIAYLRELAGLPELVGVRPPFETGLVRFEQRGQPYEFLIEITDTPTGPDVTIHVTG